MCVWDAVLAAFEWWGWWSLSSPSQEDASAVFLWCFQKAPPPVSLRATASSHFVCHSRPVIIFMDDRQIGMNKKVHGNIGFLFFSKNTHTHTHKSIVISPSGQFKIEILLNILASVLQKKILVEMHRLSYRDLRMQPEFDLLFLPQKLPLWNKQISSFHSRLQQWQVVSVLISFIMKH